MQFEELFREAQRQAASIRAATLRYERAFGGRVPTGWQRVFGPTGVCWRKGTLSVHASPTEPDADGVQTLGLSVVVRVGRGRYVASDVQRAEVRDAFIGRDIPVEWEPTTPGSKISFSSVDLRPMPAAGAA